MRDIKLLLDNTTDRELYKTTIIVQNENKASQFVFTVPEDMEEYSCRMLFKLNDNELYATSALVPDDDYEITYVITNVITFESGVLRVEIQFYDETDGVLVKSLIIPFTVVACIGNLPVIIPDEYTEFVRLIDHYMDNGIYDPDGIEDDCFDMANMKESDTEKVFTSTERENLDSLVEEANNLAYGEVYFVNNTAILSVAAGTEYTKITVPDPIINQQVNIERDLINKNWVISEAGLYIIRVGHSSYSGTNNITLYTSVFKNGVKQDNITLMRKFAAAGDVSTGYDSGLIRCEVGDTIDTRMRHTSGTAVNMTLVNGTFSIQRICA